MRPKFSKRVSSKTLPPGTLVSTTDRTGEVKVTIIDYNESVFLEKQVRGVDECFELRDKPTVTWINVDGLNSIDIVAKLGSCYQLHPLVLEDILSIDQRPKLEIFENYVSVVLKMLSYNEKNSGLESEQVSLIFGKNFLISFQEKEGDVFDLIRDRLRNAKGRIRKSGSDYLTYALIDAIIDNYFSILEKFGERIAHIEEELVKDPSPKTVQTINGLKRELIFLRKSVWPLREVISGLTRGDTTLVKKETVLYLRDIYDHTIQVIDTIETSRDMVSGMLDIYLTNASNRMNEIMKILTVIATIFIPLTFITGIYGMNFKNMPELSWQWGYLTIVGLMFVMATTMLIYFKKKNWY
ncbi:MAG: magnesium/cobalt transporter CorA [Candidatus Omnitrophica bacterium]|nr:magnesium/cobalt transporter CorA [Candidatus Omnitrophota bacterium]